MLFNYLYIFQHHNIHSAILKIIKQPQPLLTLF